MENFSDVIYTNRYSMPWIVNYRGDVREVQLEDESDRDFDSGIVLHETKDKVATGYYVFFFIKLESSILPLEYLKGSRVQHHNECLLNSFPYTPCWMKLFENN